FVHSFIIFLLLQSSGPSGRLDRVSKLLEATHVQYVYRSSLLQKSKAYFKKYNSSAYFIYVEKLKHVSECFSLFVLYIIVCTSKKAPCRSGPCSILDVTAI